MLALPPPLQRLAIGAVTAAAVVGLSPPWSELGRAATDPAGWISANGTDEAVAALARLVIWLLAGWVALALTLSVLAALAGGHRDGLVVAAWSSHRRRREPRRASCRATCRANTPQRGRDGNGDCGRPHPLAGDLAGA
jgi:hypothetical protein